VPKKKSYAPSIEKEIEVAEKIPSTGKLFEGKKWAKWGSWGSLGREMRRTAWRQRAKKNKQN